MRAAVEAAEDWGGYVVVHAYTPRAVQRALKVGVKCIDHGHLLDEATAELIVEHDAWWSVQPFNPYPGVLGVVEVGAMADLLLVDGNPLTDLSLVATPDTSFVVIMKDGTIHKDTLATAG